MLSAQEIVPLAARVAGRLRARSAVLDRFFESEAPRLAQAARDVAARFTAGGRLYAFGSGPYATDAAHVSVEFVHPVIVGKRALPAFDASAAPAAFVRALVGSNDIAIAFGPPEGDPGATAALRDARRKGAFTVAWPGDDADYAVRSPAADPHLHQEAFELLGHTLYESVQVFLEHAHEPGADVGAAAFLYPYLGTEQPDSASIVADVARSIVGKARDANALRERLAGDAAESIARAVLAIAQRLEAGGRLLIFGNGGSATDATDFALDCVAQSPGTLPIPAISLAAEPAILSAIANDVGVELTFVRQLIAQARPVDVAFAMSTSGGSANVVAALAEARKRGLLTVALLGYDGGAVVRGGLADHAIVVRCDYIPRIQEAQAAIYHVIRAALAETGRHA